jgi:hypothetical protein
MTKERFDIHQHIRRSPTGGEGNRVCQEDAFIERFRPIVNHINPNASFDFGYGGCIFETYGEEYEFVRAQNPRRIWTLIEADGVLYAESGVHFVNRLGYFVSETPFQTDEYLSFCLDDEISDDEAQR